MIQKTIGIVLFLMGLMVVIVPRYILPVCEHQGYSKMACSYTALSEMFLGFIVMVSSLGIFFSRSAEALRWLALILIASGTSVLLIPEAIGYCHSSNMPCNYGTIPVLRLTGVLIILVSFGGFFASFKRASR
jgi:hypothetical protein